LECLPEVEHARVILARGTSADQQVALYEDLRAKGRTRMQALHAVVDWLVKTTAGQGKTRAKRRSGGRRRR
jgi:glutamate---cysteine ligase / carboxylate-amine ligase